MSNNLSDILRKRYAVLEGNNFFFCSAALLLYASHKNKMTLNTYSNRYYYQKDNVFIRDWEKLRGCYSKLEIPLTPSFIAKLVVVMPLIKQ